LGLAPTQSPRSCGSGDLKPTGQQPLLALLHHTQSRNHLAKHGNKAIATKTNIGLARDRETLSVEERFANEVALGKTQAAAFRMANPRSTKWKDGSVYVKASLMMAKAKLKKRIVEIQQMLLIRSIWSREQSVTALKEVIDAPDRKSDVVAAVRDLNVMKRPFFLLRKLVG
jgi:hypothetical protein